MSHNRTAFRAKRHLDAPSDWVLDISSGATYSASDALPKVAQASNSTYSLPNSALGRHYASLRQTIADLGELDEAHDFFVDSHSVKAAQAILDALRMRFATPPQLLPMDGASLTFTWDTGAYRRYLTLAGEDATEMVLQKATKMRCLDAIDLHNSKERDDLLDSLAGEPSSVTAITVSDVRK